MAKTIHDYAIDALHTELYRKLLLIWPDVPKDILRGPLFDYQWEVLKHFFGPEEEKLQYLMLNCGRKYSKTFICDYFLIRKALSFVDDGRVDDPVMYYVTPTAEQGNEINWIRLKTFCPEKIKIPGRKGYFRLITSIKESKREITFFNRVRIRLVGSTGVSKESLRGGQPLACVYDEFKDHDPLFHKSMHPNYNVYNAQLLIIGTPPYQEQIDSGDILHYTEMMQECDIREDCAVYSRSGGCNPIPSIREGYEKAKKLAYSRGRDAIAEFECEFEGKIVYGNRDNFLPQFSMNDLVDPETLEKAIFREPHRYAYSVIFDPGGGHRWGVLFFAVDRETSSLIVLDKIVLKRKSKIAEQYMSHEGIFRLALDKIRLLSPPGYTFVDWKFFYDSANAEFKLNIGSRDAFKHIKLVPVNKNKFKKMEGYSQIKDLKMSNRLIISAKARELIEEFQAIKLDVKGIPHKTFDELTDCLRYAIYEFDNLLTPVENAIDPTQGMDYWQKVEYKIKHKNEDYINMINDEDNYFGGAFEWNL